MDVNFETKKIKRMKFPNSDGKMNMNYFFD